jgi:hypothetical protein
VTNQMKTVAEAMAMAVFRREWDAAFALADKLIDLRNNPESLEQQAAAIHLDPNRHSVDGYRVYSWPEFQAFCRRAGIVWGLHTKRITITLEEGMSLMIYQEYNGHDMGPQETPNETGESEEAPV